MQYGSPLQGKMDGTVWIQTGCVALGGIVCVLFGRYILGRMYIYMYMYLPNWKTLRYVAVPLYSVFFQSGFSVH